MKHTTLGRTGLEVPGLWLGCGDFGGIGSAPNLVGKGLDRSQAFDLMDRALAAGVVVFDTASSYGGGNSELFIGEWLAAKGSSVRGRVLVSSKIGHRQPAPHGRDSLTRDLEGSLTRLGVDRIDLCLIRGTDASTPLEETLGALDDLAGQGKIGHLGAANVTPQRVQQALAVSAAHGLARFEWVQSAYSLLARGDEREMLPLCRAQGLGHTPFSPLAGGWLAGIYRAGAPLPPDSRMALGHAAQQHLATPRTFAALDGLRRLSDERGESMAALATAWVLTHPDVTAPIIGPHSGAQLDAYLRAVELPLSAQDREKIGALFGST